MYRRGFAKQNIVVIQQFISKMTKERPDLSQKDKKDITQKLDKLRKYSFCKGHATAFAYLVWALAYHKAHNPQKFWCSTLTHTRGSYKRWVWYREAKNNGNLKLSISLKKFPEWSLKGNRLIEKSTGKYQSVLFPEKFSIEKQYRQFGYWIHNSFYPNCYYTRNGTIAFFKGLIAIGKKTKGVTYLTIGYSNSMFLDLVVKEHIDWMAVDLIEGVGKITVNSLKQTIIQVDNFTLH
jgi:hypothetical protein